MGHPNLMSDESKFPITRFPKNHCIFTVTDLRAPSSDYHPIIEYFYRLIIGGVRHLFSVVYYSIQI